MTSEEAISVLRSRIEIPETDTYGGMCDADYLEEAIDTAIQALKFQSKIIEIANKVLKDKSNSVAGQLFKILEFLALNSSLLDEKSEFALKKAISDECKIASGEYAPVVHGRWTNDVPITCSHCGSEVHYDDWEQPLKSKHCSECGAIMDERDDNHEAD